ncbi:unnamed protein product [Clonostachys rosea]|uniref:Enoyl reductase (ER) domain-containing protein n=1 Tax=Bionectria ochroleuca TaxID=29856 RepID=A0ABY6U6E7_BIOOC|nr:unnamed protein product [Clonostachys rosea]
MATTLVGTEYTIYRSDGGVVSTTKAKIPALRPTDVLIRVTHSGVCHTDSVFCGLKSAAALGHEGVGIVEEIGSAVKHLKVGDRAGGGFHRGACGDCKYCLSGRDIWCRDRIIFGESDFENGTFSEYFIAQEGYVHKIPDAMSSVDAAPLQCAGATVYAALKETVSLGQRVGILGIGGLGHLAIQYASKMGAATVVYSTTADKEAEARFWGASEFYLVNEMFDKQQEPVDVLIIAGTKYPDWDKALNDQFLARDGVIVPLSAPVNGPLSFSAYPMLFYGYHVHHTLVASRNTHRQMLDFSARHGIKPLTQVFKHSGLATVEEIFEKLEANQVRYRAVMEY